MKICCRCCWERVWWLGSGLLFILIFVRLCLLGLLKLVSGLWLVLWFKLNE